PEVLRVCHTLSRLASERGLDRIVRGTAVVSFDHDRALVDAVSRRCDVRILWGGDDSIRALRESPLRADAREISFPDRLSLAIVGASGWNAADEREQERIVHAFCQDVWTFHQLACSSPKALVFLGDAAACTAAGASFWPRVDRELERLGVDVPAATSMENARLSYGALADGAASGVARRSNQLWVLATSNLADLRDRKWGGGLVAELEIRRTEELGPLLQPSDQTLTYAALRAAELDAIEPIAVARGIARLVPMGRALAFTEIWDGIDLVNELTRLVVIERATGGA
ncbi:MAG: acyl-CoA reductase, partial [Vicinamibacterales bacterium]